MNTFRWLVQELKLFQMKPSIWNAESKDVVEQLYEELSSNVFFRLF